MTLDADVVIVGAGPAGSAAAITLGASGRRVVLVDRAEFPRPKVCGDGLTPRALAGLDRLGVWTQLSSHAVPIHTLRTLDLRTTHATTGPIPSRVDGEPPLGAVVRRDLLDDTLRLRAIEVGAEFWGGIAVDSIEQPALDVCVVEGAGRWGRWRRVSRSVILADGAGGHLGARVRRCGTLAGVALRQYWRSRSVGPSFTICIPLELPDRSYAGYGWIFPVDTEVANVGVGLYGVRAGRELRRVYDAFLERLRTIDPLWAAATPCGAAHGGLLRSGGPRSPSVQGAILLAGDAAAVTNPFTGEGIAQALDCGEMAARSVIEHFERGADLTRDYIERLQTAFPQSMRIADHLPWLMARGEHFVAEFWGAVSPPLATIGRAVRSIALEEPLARSTPTADTRVDQVWKRLGVSLESSFPILAQLIDAIRGETQALVDSPLLAFWATGHSDQDEQASQLNDIAELLALATLICVLGDATRGRSARAAASDASEGSLWAINSVALGAADILVSRFFLVSARVATPVSVHCTRAFSRALATLCGYLHAKGACDDAVAAILGQLARDFGAAARTSLARAA